MNQFLIQKKFFYFLCHPGLINEMTNIFTKCIYNNNIINRAFYGINFIILEQYIILKTKVLALPDYKWLGIFNFGQHNIPHFDKRDKGGEDASYESNKYNFIYIKFACYGRWRRRMERVRS